MSDSGLSLVTGGAGFIGRHLVSQLTEAGETVRVLDPLAAPADFPSGVDVIQGSVLDPAALDGALEGVKYIFHLAAKAHLWSRNKADFEAVNVGGTKALLAAVRAHAPEKIIITSSETVLRGWKDANPAPIMESDPTPEAGAMAGPYTRSKHAQDALAREAVGEGLPIIMVYPTVPMGPGDRHMTAPSRMVLDLLRGKTPAMLETGLNFIAVEDAARGHVLAAEKGQPGGRYILGGENMTIGEFLALLSDVSGHSMPSARVPYWLAKLSARAMELAAGMTGRAPKASLEGVRLARYSAFVDTSKAASELGFQAGPLGEALRRQIDWFEAEGHL